MHTTNVASFLSVLSAFLATTTTVSAFPRANEVFARATSCPAGSYFNTTIGAGGSCTRCEPGNFCAGSTTGKKQCNSGTFQPAPGQVSCISATNGSYVPNNGATSQIPCAIGSYQPYAGKNFCYGAPSGRFAGQPGMRGVCGTCCGWATAQSNGNSAIFKCSGSTPFSGRASGSGCVSTRQGCDPVATCAQAPNGACPDQSFEFVQPPPAYPSANPSQSSSRLVSSSSQLPSSSIRPSASSSSPLPSMLMPLPSSSRLPSSSVVPSSSLAQSSSASPSVAPSSSVIPSSSSSAPSSSAPSSSAPSSSVPSSSAPSSSVGSSSVPSSSVLSSSASSLVAPSSSSSAAPSSSSVVPSSSSVQSSSQSPSQSASPSVSSVSQSPSQSPSQSSSSQPAPSPSPSLSTYSFTGALQAFRVADNSALGYLMHTTNNLNHVAVGTSRAAALNFQFSVTNFGPSGSQLDVTALNTPYVSNYPLFGGIVGPVSTSDDLGPGSYNYAFPQGVTHTSPGSTPQKVPNSYTGNPSCESAIWSFDNSTRLLTPQWINTDGSAPATYITNLPGYTIVLTGDPVAFQNTFGLGGDVIYLKLVD
ncbi:hypothetical protein MIND_00142200 [Mycena indigotica]|uniref:Uncharacterized protein n=1 Tax=Mycena indigotica TaxID=2126181 RepID=A0A8H6TF59_9AGAR|nr:uncharacterized protein MIND_00142200 [Mycena indigotica]KAF7316236.1 hypothetical protein MIND_00142200 [Mycena indigotica]